MLRSVLSVLAGYATMAVLVIISTAIAAKTMLHATDLKSASKLKPTPAYLVVNLGYSGLFALIGGFVTALIATHDPLAHALALAALMFVLALVSFVQTKDSLQPKWYGPLLMVYGPACALIGGWLRSSNL